MPPPRRWYSPPTRREITLLIFSLALFVLSYNLETSLRVVGVNPKALKTLNDAYLGLGKKDPGLDADGRRPLAWRDDLEKIMVGDWEWKEGRIAAVEHAQNTLSLGEGEKKGFSYVYNVDGDAARSAGRDMLGIGVSTGLTGMQQILKFKWGHEGAQTRAVAHVPGYTIFENAFILNGTFFLVTDSPSSLPPLGSIASSLSDPTKPPRPQDWKVINSDNASVVLGTYGGRLYGTSWLSTDPPKSQDPYTVFSLLHTHNYLLLPHSGKAFTSASGLRIMGPGGIPNVDPVTPPIRLIFPSVPAFSSPQLPPPGGDEKEHPPLRVKSYNGLHPQFLKAVFPTTTISYSEDWKDFADMSVPYVFDRLVVADSGAAARGREQWTVGWTPPLRKSGVTVGNAGSELRKRAHEDPLEERQDDTEESQIGKPVWAAPFVGFPTLENWWTPVRASLLSYLRLPADPVPDAAPVATEKAGIWGRKKSQPAASKPVLTYISMQDEPVNAGSRLKREDHIALLEGLSTLLNQGHLSEVNVVRGNGTTESWEERMRAVARSSIVIGPFGPQLSDCLFMRVPPPPPAVPSLRQDDSLQQPPTRSAVAPVLMEFFPPGVFRRDQEFAVHSVGMRYAAWWNGRMFSGNSLPPVIGDVDVRVAHLEDSIISLDAEAVVKAIQEEAIMLTKPSS